ncbi:hypothetical protein SFRURICE_013492 [Spodoptera frugiperda]|nr:hypothetical protein SFRURICE_013492 [Spodoptera frugiperda]
MRSHRANRADNLHCNLFYLQIYYFVSRTFINLNLQVFSGSWLLVMTFNKLESRSIFTASSLKTCSPKLALIMSCGLLNGFTGSPVQRTGVGMWWILRVFLERLQIIHIIDCLASRVVANATAGQGVSVVARSLAYPFVDKSSTIFTYILHNA